MVHRLGCTLESRGSFRNSRCTSSPAHRASYSVAVGSALTVVICDRPSTSPKWFSSSVSPEEASSELIGLGAGRCGRRASPRNAISTAAAGPFVRWAMENCSPIDCLQDTVTFPASHSLLLCSYLSVKAKVFFNIFRGECHHI